MSAIDIIRAWKDVDYRLSLDLQQQTMLPKHPAGDIELQDDDLEGQFFRSQVTQSSNIGCPPPG